MNRFGPKTNYSNLMNYSKWWPFTLIQGLHRRFMDSQTLWNIPRIASTSAQTAITLVQKSSSPTTVISYIIDYKNPREKTDGIRSANIGGQASALLLSIHLFLKSWSRPIHVRNVVKLKPPRDTYFLKVPSQHFSWFGDICKRSKEVVVNTLSSKRIWVKILKSD